MSREIEVYIRFPLYRGLTLLSSQHHYDEKEYATALRREMEITLARECSRGAIPGRVVFGGSSGWISSQASVRMVFQTLHALFDTYGVSRGSQIPILVKLSPQDVTEAACKLLSRCGVTGVILRALSFHDDYLKAQQATHTAGDLRKAYFLLRKYGHLFTALELWNSTPLSREAFRTDLETVLDLGVSAVTMRSVECNHVAQDMFVSALECAGYKLSARYYVHPDSPHSMLLKRSMRQLGLGAGAKSYEATIKGERKVEKKNPDSARAYRKYIEQLYNRLQKKPFQEKIERYEGFIYTSFMTKGELNLDELEAQFHVPLESIHPGLIQILEHLGFLQIDGRSLRLTVEGRKLAANVISNFEIRDEDRQHFIAE